MKAYVYFSVHEKLFDPVGVELRQRWGVTEFCGFVWSAFQAEWLESRATRYSPLRVFTRDCLPAADQPGTPDLEFLAQREREYGVSLHRMIASERHLLNNRSYDQVMRMAVQIIRVVEAAYREAKPDFVFTEDVSCLTSYIHFAEARRLGIPFWVVGSARLPYRLSVYKSGLQHWEATNARFEELRQRGLSEEQRAAAVGYLDGFRNRPVRPTGMETRARPPRIAVADVHKFVTWGRRYLRDRDDPTGSSPPAIAMQRFRRIARQQAAQTLGLFEERVPGEKYVLYPIHFQPEASTLVQAPLYVDQLALIADMAKSLPVGYRLYVKEHVSNRGRRPLEFYKAIRSTFGVRLLGPDQDTWSLVRDAAAIAVITGTMGWEGLIFEKPVITFGDVFYNVLPQVYRASAVPKDGWYDLFRQAISEQRRDPEALIAYVAALRETSYPGFMKNPNTFPQVLEQQNVRNIADALGQGMGLTPPGEVIPLAPTPQVAAQRLD